MNMDKTIPITASADGKTNAFSHCCNVVGHYRNYAVCLHLQTERKDGRLDVLYSDCSVAIGKKRCPAIAMRKEEIAAGHAIYFKERIKTLGEAFMDTARAAMQGLGLVSKTEPMLPPSVGKKTPQKRKSSVIESIDTGGYAEAITIAAAAPVIPVIKLVPIAGETLIEMARRMKQQREAV